jgi:hypothetical protein
VWSIEATSFSVGFRVMYVSPALARHVSIIFHKKKVLATANRGGEEVVEECYAERTVSNHD